jgi:hypothetical protein
MERVAATLLNISVITLLTGADAPAYKDDSATHLRALDCFKLRHCERSEAIQSIDALWIASGFTLAMTYSKPLYLGA